MSTVLAPVPRPVTVPAAGRRVQRTSGWVWALTVAAARAYLTFLATLVIIASVPVLIGWDSYVVESGSMAPTLATGDIVVTSPIAAGQKIQVGQILAFTDPLGDGRSGSHPILIHRVVGTTAEGLFLTGGDANRARDSTPVSRQAFVGWGRLRIPWIGLPAVWARNANYPLLALWALLTIAALSVAAQSSIGRRRPRSRHGTAESGGLPGRGRMRLHWLNRPTMRWRAARTITVGVVVGAVFVLPSAAYSGFSATTISTANSWATIALGAPSGLSATPAGHNVNLAWTGGLNGTGYTVGGAANGPSPNCTTAIFASLGSTTATTYTDLGRFAPQGSWFCYQTRTTLGSWTSASNNPTAAAQIGFVAGSVTFQNGGTSGRLDTADRIVITFNQPVTTATGPSGSNTVCTSNTNFLLGSTTTSGASCQTGETLNLGSLTGGTTNANGRWAATWVWSNNNQTLTVTLGSRTSGSSPTVAGTWRFNPVTTTAKLQTATGAFHLCDTNTIGSACLPTATGSL